MFDSVAPSQQLLRPAWPLVFALTPSEPSFARRAHRVIDHSARVPASPEQVYDEFTELAHGTEWLDQFLHIDLHTPEAPPDRRIYTETFTFMSLRFHLCEAERGRRWVASVDNCSLPLAAQMLEEVTFEPMDDGSTLFRWRIHYTPSRLARPVIGPLEPHFGGLFKRSTAQLATFFQNP
jgi:hypothetical protein